MANIKVYAGVADIAQWCGVGSTAVSNWLTRYHPKDARHPGGYPMPVARIGNPPRKGYYGWRQDQRDAWVTWHDWLLSQRSEGRHALEHASRTAAGKGAA